MFLRVVCCSLLALAACRSSEIAGPESSQAPATAQPAPEPARIAPPSSATRIASNDDTYVVRFTPELAALPNNAPFELTIWIADARSPDAPARDVALAVDAAMPEHGHGMVRRPIVERADDGRFVARGMLLHMGGRWELYFDVTRGAVTERAQAEVVLE